MKNVWKQLKPHYQIKIRQAAHKYTSAKRLKYQLMASDGWYDLNLDTIRSCLLYTSPSPRDKRQSRMPSSA